ncbi:MAG TPA: hypothetical protein PLD82_07900, partial [Spirochaetota bacterium]|nr:hypothetical protein [Spirochaetota bacterium]
MKNTPSRRKILALIGIVAALSLFAFSLVQGYWYYNDFVTETDNWTLGYRYARNGFFDNGNNASTISRAGGTYLRFTGVVNTNDANMDRWTGRAAYYIGAEYSASRTAPFGVEFLRGTTQLDPHGSTSNSESDRHSVAQTFWLFNGTPPTTDGGSFANSVFMYEMMRMSANVSGNPVQPRSTWGRYVASEQRFNLKNALRP